ncbi:hypothetical protein [Neotabrizicola sp. sgz301269]|uniref:hypothetical protein n=1 Tax=Neotabrizicola sp. sgz301269 TaxID=3276282 RepID=UPI00376FCB75
MTHHLRYPVDAPFMDVAHQLLKAREIAADPLVFTKPARAEALETLMALGNEHDSADIASLRLSLSGRPVDRPGWGHPVMMLLYAVLLIVGGFLLRGVV